ncbi:MAG: 6-pyruvoyl tetrahydropterin synthase [Acidobacteria bacterium]|nr:MAG: 6-pyruvoyl tetrahydropterin synthase [Acidobacteriota bacterium]
MSSEPPGGSGGEMSFGYITRRFRFCASHRYWVSDWSEERNQAVFGSRISKYGHGHNYTMDVTLKGEVNPVTGMVINLSEVKQIIGTVVNRFDHAFLNVDLPYFSKMQPTAENLSRIFWRLIEPGLPAGVFLHRVRLYTTESVFAEYFGDGAEAVFSKRFVFSATHRLHSDGLTDEKNREVYGKCNNEHGHGHNYEVIVSVKKPIDAVTGMTLPLKELERIVRDFLKTELQGKRLDMEVAYFRDKPATSENLIHFIRQGLEEKISAFLYRIKLKETNNNFFETGELFDEQ